ncbi:MAG: biopolymer transporter ExbD [Pyrinomonadaceae bacterium]|nr:biopolymer transporter ExbD [Pyrinomonadaceae bacterium]MCX7640931.1 biopolymer transporter ExbD [Pyrinomonadaceae bacterium]MDW8304713.1 biopolymer transporter ExbD [Acidobacteriota bacterium]
MALFDEVEIKHEEAEPNINVTPLIDVLLVLLIIFMVISPSRPTRFEAKVPAEPKPQQEKVVLLPNPNALIVFVAKNGKLRLNQEDMGDLSNTEPLTQKLREVFNYREREGIFREGTNEIEKTVFIKAPRSMRYGDVAKVVDAVKTAGAQPVGLQIDDLEQ